MRLKQFYLTTISIVFISIIFLSCSSGVRITGSWANKEKITGKQYKKVFIAALTGNAEVKTVVENDLAAAATAQGYAVVKSNDIFPPSFTSSADNAVVLQKVREQGCDAIFTIAVINKESDVRYVPGSTMYQPMGFGYYGNFGRYYGYRYPMMYQPGYYTNDKTYFLESNLYDAASEDLLWSAQSKVYNPSNLEKVSREHTALLVKKLTEDGLISK